jgi:NADH-quinone oxidoreductase subunit E
MSGLTHLLTAETVAKIDHWVAKYPTRQKRSAVIAALTATQLQNDGWLTTELMDAVAEYLELPTIWVYEVATFYDMYDLKPVGKHKIRLCTNVSCMLRGSDEIADHIKQKLGVKFGQSTPDGRFVLKEAECLAACCNAPMMMVGLDYHVNLTTEKVDEILDGIK